MPPSPLVSHLGRGVLRLECPILDLKHEAAASILPMNAMHFATTAAKCIRSDRLGKRSHPASYRSSIFARSPMLNP
jgi:hypothetical protein